MLLSDDRLVIRELAVEGAALTAAREADAQGRELDVTVRRMLEVGGAVLLHGSGKATVDAVAAEVDRVLAVLAEKADTADRLRRLKEKTSFRGLDYEDALAPVLDHAFEPHGDAVEHLAGTPGVTGAKTGDFLVTLNPATTGGRTRRIVVEAKKKRLTLNEALAELDAALLNREADAGLLVFAHQDLAPMHGRLFRAYPDRRLMVVWDPESGDDLALDVGYQLARSLALRNEREEIGFDKGRLGDDLNRLVSIVEGAGRIKQGLNAARRGLDSAEQSYEEMREEALALLYELQDLVDSE